jgi:VWFA-related protein
MFPRIIPSLILLASIAPLPAWQAAPQTPSSQTPTIKTTVDEVLLDVIVRDRKGKPITDLKPEEITIVDSGAKQKIAGFRLVEGTEAISSGSRTALDPLRQLRLVTLVFEGMAPDQRQIARQAAIDLIRGAQAQNVYYSVVTIMGRLHVLQEFTNDKNLLRKAIEKATSGLSIVQMTSESDRIKGQLQQLVASGTAGEKEPASQQTDPQAAQRAAQTLGAEQTARRLAEVMLGMLRFDASISEGSRMTIFGLQSLVRGLYSMPGRKSILYFSWGMWLPTHLDEPFRNLISLANRGNVTFYGVDTRGVMTGGQNTGAFAELSSAASDSAKTVMRTEGAVTIGEITASDRMENSMRANVQMPLRGLSESTGGFLIGESNDLRGPLRQVHEEINSYYEIAYNPGIENYDGSYRKLTVEIARKDVVVHSRSGYFALPPDLRASGLLSYEVPLLRALSSTPIPRDFDFRSSAMRFQPSPQGLQAAVVVEVPLANLQFTEDKASNTFKGRLSMVALVKNDKGEVVQKLTRDLPLQGPLEKLAQIKMGNFIYKEQFDVPPGKYVLETAAIDRESGRIGAKRANLVVQPRKPGVALSNVCLVRGFQPNAKDIEPDDPFVFQGGKITPTLSGAVKAAQGALLSMFFVVYPDPSIPDKPTVEIEYIKDGQVVGKGSLELPAPDARGRIPYVMSSSAASMPPGSYEIRAIARQGSTTADDRTFVTIEQ